MRRNSIQHTAVLRLPSNLPFDWCPRSERQLRFSCLTLLPITLNLRHLTPTQFVPEQFFENRLFVSPRFPGLPWPLHWELGPRARNNWMVLDIFWEVPSWFPSASSFAKYSTIASLETSVEVDRSPFVRVFRPRDWGFPDILHLRPFDWLGIYVWLIGYWAVSSLERLFSHGERDRNLSDLEWLANDPLGYDPIGYRSCRLSPRFCRSRSDATLGVRSARLTERESFDSSEQLRMRCRSECFRFRYFFSLEEPRDFEEESWLLESDTELTRE